MDELIRRCYDRTDENKHDTCNSSLGDDCLQCSSNMYWDNNEVSYNCENKRFIYVARYLPVHSSEIYEALRQLLFQYHDKIAKKDEIVFASFGAGPGIDTYAFHRWLNSNNDELKCENITAYRIEACPDWTDLAKEVMFSNTPGNMARKYMRYIADITIENITLERKFDIATLSYVVSELDDDGIDKLINNIQNNKNKESYIIINDRPEKDVIEKIDKIMKEVAKGGYSQNHFDNEHCGFSFDDEIYSEFGPKVYRKSVYFVGEMK